DSQGAQRVLDSLKFRFVLRAILQIKRPHRECLFCFLYSFWQSRIVSLQYSSYIQFFPRESSRNGRTLAGHFGLLADVYAQEVVAQSGLAARCVGVLIGSPIAQEHNRGRFKKKPLDQRGVSERSPRLRRQRLASPKEYKRARKRVCSKLHTSFGRLFTPHCRAAINFPLWCAANIGQHLRFHVDISVK